MTNTCTADIVTVEMYISSFRFHDIYEKMENYLNSRFQSSNEDFCRSRQQWYCGVNLGTLRFILSPNFAHQFS